MARETKKYTDKPIEVTPFGVDTSVFKKINTHKPKADKIIIGTVKTLEDKYGIDTLIDTFALLHEQSSDKNIELRIAGAGTMLSTYQKQAEDLKLSDKITFSGKISNTEVPAYINEMDVYLALSRLNSESFGVAIVEAMACEVPVVVSNVDGLREVVEHKVTGYIVPKENSAAAAEAVRKIIANSALAKELGSNGRKRVQTLYEWQNNVEKMCEIYKATALKT
jgi:glycosyltransferase involved in cell wall biosynthesis